jgi:hypothetical protein
MCSNGGGSKKKERQKNEIGMEVLKKNESQLKFAIVNL